LRTEEPPLDPARPIIDPHLHLWDIRPAPGAPQAAQRFLLPDLLEVVEASGHDVTHSVFVECRAMYRLDGPAELAPVGEVEFANGVAAMSASGAYGPRRIACRIVGGADLQLGARVRPLLEAQAQRAAERFRGVRGHTAYSEAGLFGFPCDPQLRGAMLTPQFGEAGRVLADMDLSLDVWCVHSQLGELALLADRLADLTIVLDHLGTPDAQAGAADEVRQDWAWKIRELAQRPNVRAKLGGLGMDLRRPIPADTGTGASEALAAAWRPYVETCVEAFGAERCMFESNFPPDRAAASYGATWNAFKTIAAGCSEGEKDRLFRRTAAEVYRIPLD
jgi:predicted TIM-barrel fold metal-dependent hydrolase